MTTDVAQDETQAAAVLAEGRALMGDPATAELGLKRIVAAAHGGNGEASHLVSLTAALDASVPDRWVYALAYLGRAAKAGHLPSQRTLAFLAGDDARLARIDAGAGLSHPECHQLHDAIDVAAWLQTPAVREVSAAPRIATMEGLVPPRACDWIVARARPHLARAQVYDPLKGGGGVAANRTNSEMRFAFEDLDLALVLITLRIAAVTGFGPRMMEPPSVLHYLKGQEFRPHYDFLDPAVPAYAGEIGRTGQRVATLLVYLNEEFEGGETDFREIGFRFKGRKGDALLFNSVTPDGAIDRRTLHAGLAPTSGEKWLFSQWIRNKHPPIP
jgi:prolyl 4-hydroxylase